ncbi:FAD/NAD(P)-binding domain-containing protein [Penicillium cinerascens]|uniref:FAD/NAD(P)-binding domain-containing protein n=1 Tax=Penicillium cinerascens TaxID=70096 RepID=A0A9W9JMG2_9EURO|nr:FAD/NAD(P)-binding domain-containing protein [Penicillium cinerascens]KAJ5198756.1 FAD/NAD(P)-binding domain-containing protein [Penicillium cinerascens]
MQLGSFVDRSGFRELLINGLDHDVLFNKCLDHYMTSDGSITAYFTDGSTLKASLLVGADGANSQVCQQYLGQFPMIGAGRTIICGKTPLGEDLQAVIRDSGLEGSSIAVEKAADQKNQTLLLEIIHFGRGETLGTFSPQDYVYWVLISPSVLKKAGEGLRLCYEESASLSLELTQGCASILRQVLEMQDNSQTSTLCISSSHPDLPIRTSSARVTMFRDAIHPMPPTAGQGANTALRDSAEFSSHDYRSSR